MRHLVVSLIRGFCFSPLAVPTVPIFRVRSMGILKGGVPSFLGWLRILDSSRRPSF